MGTFCHHRQRLWIGLNDLKGGEHLVKSLIIRCDPKLEQNAWIVHSRLPFLFSVLLRKADKQISGMPEPLDVRLLTFWGELQKPFCPVQHMGQHTEFCGIRAIGQNVLWRYAKAVADHFQRVESDR